MAPISPSMSYEIAMTAQNSIGVSREFIVRGETLKEGRFDLHSVWTEYRSSNMAKLFF